MALFEINRTDEVIKQDYSTNLTMRKVRASFLAYHDFGLSYAVNKNPRDLLEKNRQHEELIKNLQNKIINLPDEYQGESWNDLVIQIQNFTNFNKDSNTKFESFVDPTVRQTFLQILSVLENFIAKSSERLNEERARNEKFLEKNILINVIVFVVSFVFLIIGWMYMDKRVLGPIFNIISTLDKIKEGDLTAKSQSGHDEVGRLSDTLNAMTSSLSQIEQRRKERIEYIGSVAHDLGNPLNSILLGCELLLRKIETVSKEQLEKALNQIRQSAGRIQRLTSDLLEAAKDNKPIWNIEVAPVDMCPLITSILEEFKHKHPDYKFTHNSPPSEIVVLADRDRITQVMSNLLSNAVKYSPTDTEIHVSLTKKESHCLVEVIDQGSGIPDDKKSSIFQPFSRLEFNQNMAKGTGLGLAIVRDIIVAHHGTISVSDNPSNGSIFHIELPLTDPDPVPHH